MPWQEVEPVVDISVRGLCVKSYPLHNSGCPNYGKKEGCPPKIQCVYDIFDLNRPTYCIWNTFDLNTYINKRMDKFPNYTQRQLYNCLYWQGTARKNLRLEIEKFKIETGINFVNTCPEAIGINVTETMKNIGHILEWPPINIAYQVAIGGYKKDNVKSDT